MELLFGTFEYLLEQQNSDACFCKLTCLVQSVLCKEPNRKHFNQSRHLPHHVIALNFSIPSRDHLRIPKPFWNFVQNRYFWYGYHGHIRFCSESDLLRILRSFWFLSKFRHFYSRVSLSYRKLSQNQNDYHILKGTLKWEEIRIWKEINLVWMKITTLNEFLKWLIYP